MPPQINRQANNTKQCWVKRGKYIAFFLRGLVRVKARKDARTVHRQPNIGIGITGTFVNLEIIVKLALDYPDYQRRTFPKFAGFAANWLLQMMFFMQRWRSHSRNLLSTRRKPKSIPAGLPERMGRTVAGSPEYRHRLGAPDLRQGVGGQGEI